MGPPPPRPYLATMIDRCVSSRRLAPILPALLGGCSSVVLAPAGDVARQQGNLVILATALMLLIIVPVVALIALFAWRYRHTNDAAAYAPDWHHSTALELVIWAAPLLIIICLGAVTWTGTHLLDPYRPIGRIDAVRPISKKVRPLRVQVVALDWKWLFIYPDYGIATVNELAAPVDRPIRFDLTASSVMNAFSIPAMVGQIYAMPGMTTKLNAVVNRPGDYAGFSSNFSGDGFSGMRFRFHAVSPRAFDGWIARARASGATLDRAGYLRLEKPGANVPAMRFASVAPGLFDAAADRCVAPGQTCMRDRMRADAAARHEKPKPMAMAMTEPLCDDDAQPERAIAHLTGAGLPLPGTRAAPAGDRRTL